MPGLSGMLAASVMLVASPARSAPPVELWHGVAAGLTTAQVARLVPSAKTVDGKPGGFLLDSNVRERLATDAWSLNGVPVHTRFYFDDDRLVAMVASLPRVEDRPWSASVLKSIAEDMTRTHGPSADQKIENVGPCQYASGRWVRSATAVTMSGVRCSTKRSQTGAAAVNFIPTALLRRYVEQDHLTPLPPDAYRSR